MTADRLVCERCARASQMLVQRAVRGAPRLCVACDYEGLPSIEGLWALARMYRERADEERWPEDMRSWLYELVEWAETMQPEGSGLLPN